MADAICDLLQRCLNRIEELQLCEADEREVEALARDLRAALAAQQSAQGEAVDKGLWRAESEHSNPVTGVWVASDDFEHDVRLYVNGDFESQEQRIAYAKRIAEQLNAPPAPSVNVPDELTPKQIVSACFSLRHDYGLLPERERDFLAYQCREWWRAISKELNQPSLHPMVLAATQEPPHPADNIRDAGPAAFGGRRTRREEPPSTPPCGCSGKGPCYAHR